MKDKTSCCRHRTPKYHSVSHNNENTLYCDGHCSAKLLSRRSSQVLSYQICCLAAKVIPARTTQARVRCTYTSQGVTVEVLSKASEPNVERLSVGTANFSLLSMLRGSRTNTCRDVTISWPGRLSPLRRSSIAKGCAFLFEGRFTIRKTRSRYVPILAPAGSLIRHSPWDREFV